MSLESASLVFQMNHPDSVVRTLGDAVRIARSILDSLEVAAPEHVWRADEHDEPVRSDRLAELVLPTTHSVADAGYTWAIVAGAPPLDLSVYMVVGVDGVNSSGKAELRFDERDQFHRLEEVFELMSADRFDRLSLSAGVDWLLRLGELKPNGSRPPSIGWRNRIKTRASTVELDLPKWVVLKVDGTCLELTLGPSPFDCDIADAIAVRDALVEAGVLSVGRHY